MPKTPGKKVPGKINRPRKGVALISEPTEDQGSQGSTLFPILINYFSVLLIGCLHLLPLLAKSHADMVLLLVLNVFIASWDSIATDRLGEVAFLPREKSIVPKTFVAQLIGTLLQLSHEVRDTKGWTAYIEEQVHMITHAVNDKRHYPIILAKRDHILLQTQLNRRRQKSHPLFC